MSEKEKECSCGCEEHEHHHDDCGCGHEHHHHDDCGCGHDDCDCGCEDEGLVELTADDGRKLKFFVVGTIEYNGKNYCAFEPAEEIEGLSEDDLVIFELSGDDEETADLLPIKDESLLEAVYQEFCRVLDEDEALDEQEALEEDPKH